MGPHLFFMQLRSLGSHDFFPLNVATNDFPEDHKPLPGITVGTIGPKAGGGE